MLSVMLSPTSPSCSSALSSTTRPQCCTVCFRRQSPPRSTWATARAEGGRSRRRSRARQLFPRRCCLPLPKTSCHSLKGRRQYRRPEGRSRRSAARCSSVGQTPAESRPTPLPSRPRATHESKCLRSSVPALAVRYGRAFLCGKRLTSLLRREEISDYHGSSGGRVCSTSGLCSSRRARIVVGLV